MVRRALAGFLTGLLTVPLLVDSSGLRVSLSRLWRPCTDSRGLPWPGCLAGTFIKSEASVTSQNDEVLQQMFAALSVLQNNYFNGVNGTWPTSIEWTGAVVETVLSATLSSLTKSLGTRGSLGGADQRTRENLISTLYSQVTQSFFSQDVSSIKGQAYDDILWVVLGWIEAIKFVRLHAELHYPGTPDRYCNHLAGEVGLALQTLPWHGYSWTCAFAARAREFWLLATPGWDTSLCSGGMVWNPRLEPYKNAITNELWIAASIGMYEQFPNTAMNGSHVDGGDLAAGNPVWLAASIVGYKWLKAVNMTNQQGLIVDGYHIDRKKVNNVKCDVRDETVYTYNQGVILTGQRGLWLATGSASFLDEGHELVRSVIAATGWDLDRGGAIDRTPGQLPPWRGLGRGGILEERCDASGTCSQDGQAFKGIFFHHLTAFCAPVDPASLSAAVRLADMKAQARAHRRRCRGYLAWIGHNVASALATRDIQGRFGMWWGAGAFGLDALMLARDGMDRVAVNSTDYRNRGTPRDALWGAQQRWLPGPPGDTNMGEPKKRYAEAVQEELAYLAADPNLRGRGRTVETQAGGLALLRAYWELARAE